MDEGIDGAIADLAASLLLRYFSGTGPVHLTRPALAVARDRELLRLHWALSPIVAELTSYVLTHRHEIQSVLGSAMRVEDGVVRGRLDAMKTLRQRRMSGLDTVVVSYEPIRSYVSGPNQVLGWVLSQAWSLASRFSTVVLDSPGYRASIDQTLQNLEQVRRLHAVSQITAHAAGLRRPLAHAVLEAGRSRRILYHKATAAYKELLAIEAGDPEAITAMLRSTLLAPLEPWRRYELAVGYSIASVLAEMQKQALGLNFVVGDIRKPIAVAGRFAVFWQWRTGYHIAPVPEPSEQIAQSVLDSYGLSAAADRPDLVVVDQEAGAVVAIIEVKYLTGEDASDRVRGAVAQVVRYARGYAPIAEIGPLLGRSLIAVSQGLEFIVSPDPVPPDIPILIDFVGLKSTGLRAWADRLLPSPAS